MTEKSTLKRFYEEHTDRLFGLSHQAKIRVRVQILLLVFQILKSEVHSKQFDRLMRVIYETLLDPSCLHSSITELFLELVYNAFKNDPSMPRVMAGIKRLLQNAIHAETNVVVAVLIFVNKLAQNYPGLNQLLKNNFVTDFDDDDEEAGEQKNPADAQHKEEPVLLDNGGYDFFKRDPIFAKADTSLLWELTCFIEHYHPTVRKVASELMVNLATDKINYEGNPLLDFTTASFLDRFCMKKPKTSKLEAKKRFIESNKVSRAKMEEPFSIQALLGRSSSVRDEEKFIYTYFKNKVDNMGYLSKLEKRKAAKAKPRSGEDAEEDEFADRLFEKELRNAEGGTDFIDEGSAAEGSEGGADEDEEDEELDEFGVGEFDEHLQAEEQPEEDFEDDGVTLKKRAARRGRPAPKGRKQLIKKHK